LLSNAAVEHVFKPFANIRQGGKLFRAHAANGVEHYVAERFLRNNELVVVEKRPSDKARHRGENLVSALHDGAADCGRACKLSRNLFAVVAGANALDRKRINACGEFFNRA
jgi:hypothetical protein